jgi:hypothetical protein
MRLFTLKRLGKRGKLILLGIILVLAGVLGGVYHFMYTPPPNPNAVAQSSELASLTGNSEAMQSTNNGQVSLALDTEEAPWVTTYDTPLQQANSEVITHWGLIAFNKGPSPVTIRLLARVDSFESHDYQSNAQQGDVDVPDCRGGKRDDGVNCGLDSFTQHLTFSYNGEPAGKSLPLKSGTDIITIQSGFPPAMVSVGVVTPKLGLLQVDWGFTIIGDEADAQAQPAYCPSVKVVVLRDPLKLFLLK